MTEAAVARAHDGMAATSDAEALLMRRVGAGDAAACRVLVERHLGRIVGIAHRLLGDPSEAEDVAQDTFLRLWRYADRWQPRARLTTWLYRVAYNLCMDRLRARRERPFEWAPNPVASPAAPVQRNQVARIVAGALGALPERQRSAIALVYHQGLSNIDAAEVLGISVDALESLLARGRRSLREQLGALRSDLMGEL